jgi:hypothetical protein
MASTELVFTGLNGRDMLANALAAGYSVAFDSIRRPRSFGMCLSTAYRAIARSVAPHSYFEAQDLSYTSHRRTDTLSAGIGSPARRSP